MRDSVGSQHEYARSSTVETFDFAKLVSVLWRGKYWIILLTIFTVLLGGTYAYILATKKFTANARVVLDTRQEQIVDLDSVVSGLGGDQTSINTEVEVLQGRELFKKLVTQLDLTSDPEYNSTLTPPAEYSFQNLKLQVGNMVFGERPARVFTDADILHLTTDAVLKSVRISNVRQSLVFDISVESTNAKKSALIANALAELYILEQLEVKFEATEQATEWLSGRVSELLSELETVQEQVKEFNAQTQLISPEALSALNTQIKELRERQSATAQSSTDLNLKLKNLKVAIASRDVQSIIDVTNDNILKRLIDGVQSGSQNSITAFQTRTETLERSIERDAQRAAAQTNSLAASISSLEQQVAAQSEDLVKLEQLEREVEASRLIYEYFLGRLKETSVQQGVQQADSRILSLADVPREFTSPRRSLIVAIAGMLGLLLGSTFVVSRELMQNKFRSANELRDHTNLTVMGQIPKIAARRRTSVVDYLISKPSSAAAEAIRNLRTSTMMSNLDNPPQVVMVTSSIPGEGKTTNSIALAHNFAGMNKRVLLIEGDMRRRLFKQYFKISHDFGMVSVLSGTRDKSEVIVSDSRLGIDILVSEKTQTNAADVFASDAFAKMLKDLREDYDVIVIDTPPVLVVPDARVIGRMVDAILYVVRYDYTPKTTVSNGIEMFGSVGLKVTGLILSQILARELRKQSYGNYYSNYYDN